MLGFPSALKVYLAVAPVDMRKQYDGLWAVTNQDDLTALTPGRWQPASSR